MADTTPASLDSALLSRRLGELAGHERQLQVESLLHLDEYDRRKAWAEAGYPSVWEWCLRVLHLREGATARRLAAMRVLRRFPSLAEALRDGRLCLSTLAALGPVLTSENSEEVVARAAFMTKAEVEHLVVCLQPWTAPREGLRLLPQSSAPQSSAAPRRETLPSKQETSALAETPDRDCRAEPPPAPVPSRSTLEPISSDTYSLRVTVDAEFKNALDQLRSLLSHQLPDGDLGSVLREAVKCALEKHGKRKGAAEPSRQRRSAPKKTAAAKVRPAKRKPIPRGGPARGVEAGWRPVRLAQRGRPALRVHLEARARPHRAGGPRWAEHDREPQGVLPTS